VAGKGGVGRDVLAGYPPSVAALIDRLARLPGIGTRSAERLALHLLAGPAEDAAGLARAIDAMRETVRHCRVCFNFADAELCAVCGDGRRDASRVMVVEQPGDLIALEQTGMWRGVFHVLMGRVSPLEGIGPEDVTLGALLGRIDEPAEDTRGVRVEEAEQALNPTLEGDGTGLVLAEELGKRDVRVTRLARGLPAGGQVSLSNKAVLADAIEGRR